MKIKKLLPLILIAMAAVLVLSSCDAMLDAIFPTNQISVDVMVSKHTPATDFYSDWYFGYPSTVTLILTDQTSGVSTTQVGSWSDIDSNYVHYIFTFLKLGDHVYTMTAYYHSYSPPHNTYGPNFDFFDGPIDLIGGVQMPYRTGHDSTGHSADFQMYF